MNEANNGLIDIIEPTAPVVVEAANSLWIALPLAGALLLAVMVWLWWKYKLPAYRAIRQVRALQKNFEAGAHTPHETLLMLALELRHGLGLKRLRGDIFPQRCKPQDRNLWPEFMQQLDAVLYQPEADLNQADISALFVKVEYWLSRYSRVSTLKKLTA